MVYREGSGLPEVQLGQASQLLLLEGELSRVGGGPSTAWWFPSWGRDPVWGLSVPGSGPDYPIKTQDDPKHSEEGLGEGSPEYPGQSP